MVTLNRIYTRTGDDGTTMLGDGSRVRKDSARVEAYGEADELNAFVGVALTLVNDADIRRQLAAIQNTLFDVSSDLCVPMPTGKAARTGQAGQAGKNAQSGASASAGRAKRRANHPRLSGERATELEGWIDGFNTNLQPLDSFILPGGSPAAAALHVARCVCRRVERRLLTLSRKETVNPALLQYLNRLSDYLFVVARVANENGASDVKWRPGAKA
ncbi:MAG: cob(I)yrinic acid a,c-diamide adenosyltransferase [Planctomycetota bacterium]